MVRRAAKTEGEPNGAAQYTPELEDLIAQLGGEAAYVRLYRLTLGQRSYLARMGPDVDVDAVRDRFGGGDYAAQICRQGGKIMGETKFTIAGPPRDPEVIAHSPAAPEPAPKTVAESIAQLNRRLDELRNPPAAAEQANPLALTASIITALASAAAPIIQIMQENRRPRGEGRAHKEKSLMDAYHQGLKTGVILGAKQGGGGGGGGLLEKMLDTLAPALQGRATGLPPVEGGETARVAPGGGAVPARAAQLPDGSPAWAKIAAPYIAQLQPLAAKGADPQTYSQLFLDSAPDQMLDLVVEQVGRGEEFWKEFQNAFPGADRAWWEQLLGSVWFELTQPEPADNPGDVSHSNNAPAR